MTEPTPYHYTVIARALKIIDAGGPGLTLDELAAQMGMSAAHFQRTFSQWVGVSTKRYQQYLTLDLSLIHIMPPSHPTGPPASPGPPHALRHGPR